MLLREAHRRSRPTRPPATLHDRLAALGARLIVEALDGLAAGKLHADAAAGGGRSLRRQAHARRRARIDWRKTADELARQVRACQPWPGAWFAAKGERIKLLAAEPAPARRRSPGAVLDAS